MAVADGLSPTFAGNVKANAFTTPWGTTQSVFKKVAGPTAVNVFGTTNGFRGSVIAVRTTLSTASTTTVELYGNNGTICQITGSLNRVSGSNVVINLVHGTAFTAAGSLIVATTPGGAEAVVEVIFQAANPDS